MMRHPARARGFTTVELIIVMVLIGVIAAFGIPRLMSDNTMAAGAFGNHVVSALRMAQHQAVAHRRVVCASVAADGVDLRIATAPGPSDCVQALAGFTVADFRAGAADVAASGSLVGATIFFHPDGTIHSNADGTAPVDAGNGDIAIAAGGRTVRTIRLRGETGYVE